MMLGIPPLFHPLLRDLSYDLRCLARRSRIGEEALVAWKEGEIQLPLKFPHWNQYSIQIQTFSSVRCDSGRRSSLRRRSEKEFAHTEHESLSGRIVQADKSFF